MYATYLHICYKYVLILLHICDAPPTCPLVYPRRSSRCPNATVFVTIRMHAYMLQARAEEADAERERTLAETESLTMELRFAQEALQAAREQV